MTELTAQKDLSYIFRKIIKSWKFIIGFTFVALIVGFIVYLIMGTSYKAKTTFMLRNPLESDRNQVFSDGHFFQNKRYFADEDDIDKIIAISKSSAMYSAIVSEFKMMDLYGDKAEKYLRSDLKVNRNSTSEIDIEYVNKDKALGAAVANYARDFIKTRYEDYFKESNAQLAANISKQMAAISNRVSVINDSIKFIRAQYGLNDQLLPARGNTTVSQRSGGSMSQAEGLEVLVTYTNLKDKLIDEKSRMEAAIYQYESGIKEGTGFTTFFVVEAAHPDVVGQVPNPKMLFPAIALLGFIISIIVVVVKASFSKID